MLCDCISECVQVLRELEQLIGANIVQRIRIVLDLVGDIDDTLHKSVEVNIRRHSVQQSPQMLRRQLPDRSPRDDPEDHFARPLLLGECV